MGILDGANDHHQEGCIEILFRRYGICQLDETGDTGEPETGRDKYAAAAWGKVFLNSKKKAMLICQGMGTSGLRRMRCGGLWLP